MAFKNTAFLKTEFSAREKTLKVPSLEPFFEGEAEWVIRGQTGEELSRLFELEVTQKSLATVVESLRNSASVTNDLKSILGLGTDVPLDLVKRFNQLVCCSICPEINQQTAVKFAECYPVEFYWITNEITKLTGLGMQAAVKKPTPSGKSQP